MKQAALFLTFFLLAGLSAFGQNKIDTIYVAKDNKAKFTNIQQSINSIRAFLDHKTVVRIAPGVYNEKIVIPSWCQNVQLLGEDSENTVIEFADFSGKVVDGVKLSTFTSYTILVQGKGIQIKNITVKNASCNQGQAVALHVEGDQFSAINAHILGCQDTLYLGAALSRQYYQNCLIEGTTDFIFGSSTAYFENCTIKSLKNSFITAASTPKQNRYGMIFYKCHLIAGHNVDKVYLGRPWRPHAKTVFIETIMDRHIIDLGWDPWHGDATFPNKDKTAYYAEYLSKGVGANPSKRVIWSHQLTQEESLNYYKNRVLGETFW